MAEARPSVRVPRDARLDAYGCHRQRRRGAGGVGDRDLVDEQPGVLADAPAETTAATATTAAAGRAANRRDQQQPSVASAGDAREHDQRRGPSGEPVAEGRRVVRRSAPARRTRPAPVTTPTTSVRRAQRLARAARVAGAGGVGGQEDPGQERAGADRDHARRRPTSGVSHEATGRRRRRPAPGRRRSRRRPSRGRTA